MKTPTFLRSGLFLLAGLAAITTLAADEATRPYVGHVNEVKDRLGDVLFSDGDSAATVIDKLKRPHRKLSNSVWLYRGFRAFSSLQAAKYSCDNLIVSFGPGEKPVNQKVITIALANAKGLEKIKNGLKQNPAISKTT